MKVEELIEILSKFDKNETVVISDPASLYVETTNGQFIVILDYE